jgi:hypothetical protein
MKFAVKTVTCLGCKTPLRANNSVKSRSPSSYSFAHMLMHGLRWCRMSELSSQNGGVVSKTSCEHIGAASPIFETLDTVSALSRVSSSGTSLVVNTKMLIDRHLLRMFCVLVKTAPSSI